MRVAVCGKGQMGQLIRQSAEDLGYDAVIGDAFDQDPFTKAGQPFDVLLDFSHPGSLDFILDLVKDTPTALVLGTTGLSEEQVARIHEEAKVRPVFYASNYSLGVAVLTRLAKEAAAILEDWDKEIIECHHRKKADAPSGTALSLLEAIDPNDEYTHLFGREGKPGPRQKEIAVHAVRGGTVPGNHEVLFLGDQEVVNLSHSAQSRQIFVNGALNAAAFLKGKPAGLYDMEDLLQEKLSRADAVR